MKLLIRNISLVIAVLMISAVTMVPAMAMQSENDKNDLLMQEQGLSLDNSVNGDISGTMANGIVIKKLPDAAGQGASTPDAVLDAGITKMAEQGMTVDALHSARYEISVPDDLMNDATLNNARTSGDFEREYSDVMEKIRTEHPSEYADMQMMENAHPEQLAVHKDGKTIYTADITGIRFIDESTLKITQAMNIRYLDPDGNPSGMSLLINLPESMAAPADHTTSLASQSDSFSGASALASGANDCDVYKQLCTNYGKDCSSKSAAFGSVMFTAILSAILMGVFTLIAFIGAITTLLLAFFGDVGGVKNIWGPIFIIVIILTFVNGFAIMLTAPVLAIALALIVKTAYNKNAACYPRDTYCDDYNEYCTASPPQSPPSAKYCDNKMGVANELLLNVGEKTVGITSFAGEGGIVTANYFVPSDLLLREELTRIESMIIKVSPGGGVGNVVRYNADVSGRNKFASINFASIQPAGNGFIVSGSTKNTGSFGFGYRGLVMRTDSTGNELWRKTFGTDGDSVVLSQVVVSPEGNLYAVGTDGDSGLIVGLNATTGDGLEGWATSVIKIKYDVSSKADSLSAIRLTHEGNLICAGKTKIYGENVYRGWLQGISSTGTPMPVKYAYSVPATNTQFNDVIEAQDGSIITVGSAGDFTDLNAAYWRAWNNRYSERVGPSGISVKFDKNGNYLKDVIYSNHETITLNGISEARDGGYLMAGTVQVTDGMVCGTHGRSDGWVLKTGKDLNLKWQKVLGDSQDDYLVTVIEVSNGDILAAGGKTDPVSGKLGPWIPRLRADGNAAPDKIDYNY